MTLIDMLRPEQRQQLRRLRYRMANREYMRGIREARKLLCVGVDLPICSTWSVPWTRCLRPTAWLLTWRKIDDYVEEIGSPSLGVQQRTGQSPFGRGNGIAGIGGVCRMLAGE